tara:strand:- start:419 stop:628 length:210 start_codon:yes stop_codon:yes gene_type:complete
MLKSTELNYPSVETWFIGWDNDRTEIKTYSMVATTQCMTSPWDEMDYYTNEDEWLEVLLENGINPYPED